MIRELIEVRETDSWEDTCKRLGTFLGLKEPVPSCVMSRAIDDAVYAHDLISCRNAPEFLKGLLNDPANRSYEPARETNKRSNRELAAKAAGALFKWGM